MNKKYLSEEELLKLKEISDPTLYKSYLGYSLISYIPDLIDEILEAMAKIIDKQE